MKPQLNHYSCSSRVIPTVGIPVLFVVLAFLAIVLGGCDFSEEPAQQCTFDGKSYAAGETVPGVDNCNTCVCTDDGIACTAMACPDQCEYNGEFYQVGDVFDAGDGCNTCSCTEDGVGVCTQMACAPQCEYKGSVYQVGDVFDAGDGCNTCSCSDQGVAQCTLMACPEACPPPKAYEGICITVEAVAKHPVTGECCEYPTPCQVPDGLEIVTYDECKDDSCDEDGNCPAGQLCVEGTCMTVIPCETVACAPGYVAKDTDEDGCEDTCWNPCTDEDCGPYPVSANFECPDGTTQWGPSGACFPNHDGVCEWEIVTCPTECKPGEQQPAPDGCNDCVCTEGGIWACTDMACQCNPDTEWNREYVSTNPAECALLDFACPANTAAFLNECGCGCVQKDSCPEWFNCMPPSDCDPEAMALECPYSDFAY